MTAVVDGKAGKSTRPLVIGSVIIGVLVLAAIAVAAFAASAPL